jgi:iron complex outermembrane receptor protein
MTCCRLARAMSGPSAFHRRHKCSAHSTMRVGGDTWLARVGVIHAFAQNLTAPFETTTPGYDNLRMELAFRQKLRPGLGFDEVRFGIVGDNLLNDQIRNSASFKKNQILLPGRGVRAHFALTF